MSVDDAIDAAQGAVAAANGGECMQSAAMLNFAQRNQAASTGRILGYIKLQSPKEVGLPRLHRGATT